MIETEVSLTFSSLSVQWIGRKRKYPKMQLAKALHSDFYNRQYSVHSRTAPKVLKGFIRLCCHYHDGQFCYHGVVFNAVLVSNIAILQ